VLVRGALHASQSVSVCLGGSPRDVRLDVVPLQPRSSSQTVAGCLLGGYPAGRDGWGGEHVVGRVLPRFNIDTNVWGELSIMAGVYQC
jgi:hypothetical protein